MDDRVLYICSYLIQPVRDSYDRVWYSRAGLNEKQGTISSLQADGWGVTVLSPVVPDSRGFGYNAASEIRDEERGVDVVVPPTLNVYGVVPINYAFTIISTILYALVLSREFGDTVALSYNFRPENALPGLVGKHLAGFTYVLQYEDGLFVHHSRLRRVSAALTKRLADPSLDGAVCTNQPLAALLATDNTAVVRGYPSIGMPDTLPDPAYADPDTTVVMFAGHFGRVRGIDRFLDVVPRIEDDVAFWISGTGRDEQKARVRERVDDLDDDRVTYFGTLPFEEYRTRVVSADILVNFQDPTAPTSEYTFPSKLLDFMSAGRVIVSTDMSDLAASFPEELVIDGATTASLVATLAETVERYRAGDVETGERAREWIETHCTHEYAGAKYGTVFRNARAR